MILKWRDIYPSEFSGHVVHAISSNYHMVVMRPSRDYIGNMVDNRDYIDASIKLPIYSLLRHE
jgi:hypothetical protein